MMYGVESAGQIAFYNPATNHTSLVTILQLKFHRPDRMFQRLDRLAVHEVDRRHHDVLVRLLLGIFPGEILQPCVAF